MHYKRACIHLYSKNNQLLEEEQPGAGEIIIKIGVAKSREIEAKTSQWSDSDEKR